MQKSYYAIIPANVRYDSELTPNAKLLYGEITALCNEKGYCWASNAYFAELYNVSKVSISKWINQLVSKGYISSDIQHKEGSKEIVNRYLRIVNDPIKEKLDTPIKEKLKDNNTSFNTTSNKDHDSFDSTNNDYSSEFAQFWEVYPKKVSKKKAYQSFCKVMKDKCIPIDSIVNGVLKYTQSIERNKTDKKYIKHPTTFINGEHWNDEYEENEVKVNIGTHEHQNEVYRSDSVESDIDGSIFLD